MIERGAPPARSSHLAPGLRRGGEGFQWIAAPDEAKGRTCVAWLMRLDDPRLDEWLSRSPPDPADLAIVAPRADAAERLVRRRLGRLLVGAVASVPPAAVRLDRTAAGVPVVAEPTGWHVSLAGRAGWCAIAVGRGPVGIDVEPMVGESLPPDLLTPAERAWVAAQADPRRASLACWVAKEAHAKRFGRPRSLDPAAVETQPAGFARSGTDRSRIVLGGTAACVAAMAVDIE